MGVIVLTEDFMYITLNEDGTARMVMTSEELDETGTWEKDGDDKVKLTFEGDPSSFKCDGKMLTMEEDGVKFELKKS